MRRKLLSTGVTLRFRIVFWPECNIRLTIANCGTVHIQGAMYNGLVVPTWTNGHAYEISVVDGLAAVGECW